MLYKKKKNMINSVYCASVAATSLELLRQKKIADARRALGYNDAKQRKLSCIDALLVNPYSYIVVVKFVDAGMHWRDFSTHLSKDHLRFQGMVFPVTLLRSLYPFLGVGDNLRWLPAILKSPSTYLLVAQNRGEYLTIISSCLRFESYAGGNCFEILLLKDQVKLVDFRRAACKQYATEIRTVYSTRAVYDILLELRKRVLSVPVMYNPIFYTTLSDERAIFFVITKKISN